MNFFFIGYRCTGKTTIGQILAKRINFNFIDIDQTIEIESGLNIAQIVESKGWSKFRLLEKQTLLNINHTQNLVIATGGGIVTDPDNLNFILKNGFCIWLDAGIKTILDRLKSDVKTSSSRPSLTDDDLIEETKKLLKLRKPLYDKCSRMKIDTTDKTTEEIVDIISRRIENVRQQHR